MHACTLARFHAFTLSRFHAFTLSRSHVLTLSRFHAFTRSRVHAFTLSPECPQRRRAAMRILPQRRKAHPTPKGQHATPKSPHESNMQRQKAHATPKSQERLFGNGCEHPTPKGFKGKRSDPSFLGVFSTTFSGVEHKMSLKSSKQIFLKIFHKPVDRFCVLCGQALCSVLCATTPWAKHEEPLWLV